ncbi:hypothetical protein [Nocardia fusca]|uniref:Uncharacterized protein n=1 Tax=Nocardia fusca TaxID=941183 RepID=A0ABV3FFS0_9NOCA
MDFESYFPAVGEYDADIGAAFPAGQPHLGIGFDHTRLTESPLGRTIAAHPPQPPFSVLIGDPQTAAVVRPASAMAGFNRGRVPVRLSLRHHWARFAEPTPWIDTIAWHSPASTSN